MVYQASFRCYSSGQMDLSLKTMYDAFKDDIWKELGQLDPNWFEVLTAQTSVIEENGADKDDLSANQEGHFKTPLNKTAVDSQLFSTPKVFRHSGVVSSDSEEEHSFTTAQEKGSLPWMAIQSPSLFLPSLQGAQNVKSEGVKPQNEDSFDLLKTPNKSPISYAKHISESLGAQINCDISWTSSLNTPSAAVPSTLILSKSDESPCPVSVTADRNVVFVRKLFPSLSKTPKHKATSSVFQGAVSPEAHACCLQSPLRQSGDVWQLGVPDALEEVHSTVVVALDGAENILSSFFANSSSALRKVKPDRIKRKQIIQTKQNLSSSKDDTAASTEEATSDQESGQLPCTPRVKTADPAVSQWSPLSLSEIPPCALESSITTEQLQDDTRPVQLTRPVQPTRPVQLTRPVQPTRPVQLTRPSVNITNSGFVKKKRTFIYTVSAVKRQGQDKEGQSPKKDPSPGIRDSGQEIKVRQLEKAPGDGRNTDQDQPNQKKADGENISSSGDAKVQDFDMSQLCKDFAQDFSQVPNFGQQEKVAKDILNNFSPSACLSVMKQAKQKARQASLLEESDENRNMGQTCSTAEGTVRDSGFQSSAADFTRMTASSVLRSENTGQSRQFAATPFPSTNTENVHLDAEAETTLQKSKTNQTLDSGREYESHGERRTTQQFNSAGNLDKNDFIPLNSQITDSLLEKTLVPLPSGSASGFKTASNKGIHISSANLERAKRLLEDTDGKRTFGIQSIKRDHAVKQNGCQNNESMKTSNSKQLQCAGGTFRSLSSELTAAEQADVTELCSLLEEADSQFEFTQFKTAKLKRHNQSTNTPQQPDKELDPDFLADIDFDDSFSLDNGKHPAVSGIPDEMTSGSEDKPNNGITETINPYTVLSSSTLTIENSSVAPFSDNISVDKQCLLLTKPNNLSSSENDIANKMDNSSSLMHGAGFTTARGNVLRVSKQCLSKARALFADLEATLTDQKSNDKQNAKTEQNLDMCRNDLKLNLKDDCDIGEKIQDGFPKKEDFVRSDQQVLSVGDQGGTRSLKNNKMDEANDCFNDCSVMKHDDTFDKSTKHLAESIKNKSFSEYKNMQVSTSEEHVTGCTESENVNAGPTAQHIKGQHVDKVQMSRNGSVALKNAKPFHGHPFTASKPFSPLCTSTSIDSSVTAGLNTGDGFCTAGGKKVFVSADAMRRAECLLNYTQTPEDINIRPNQKEPASKSGPCVDEGLKEERNGFQTASGKEVSISKAALRNAKALLTGCERGEDEVSESLPCSKNQVFVAMPPMRGCGFSAASGKPVVLSSKALPKAKAIFSDISLSTDIPTASNSIRSDKKHENVQDDAEKMHIGFTTAGGAKVHVSQKNLLKAKDLFKELADLDLTKAMQEADAFFKDCDMDGHNRMLAEDMKDEGQLHPNERMRVSVSEEPKHGSIERTDKQVKQKDEALQQRNDGFQTASGKGVDVSSEALQRAKILLNDCDGVEKKIYTTPLQTKVNALPIRNRGFCSASGKPVTLSSEAVQKAKSLFSDIGMSTEIQNISTTTRSDRKQDSGTKTDRIHFGFTTPQGAKVSVSQKPLPKAKHLCQEFDDSASVKALQEDVFCHEETDSIPDNHSEILTEHTSETPVGESLKENLSKCKANQRVTRNISEESGYRCTRDTNDKVKQQEDICPQQSGGFQTASGKAVTVSSEALTRAQILLSEHEGVEDRIHVSKVPVNDTPIWNSGFSAASGKPVTFSSEALLKAKSFLSDIPNLPDTKRSDVQCNAEKIHSGFTTAGGGKVHVSEKSILKAKNLLRELHDEEHHYSFSTPTSPQNVQKRELSSAKVVEKVSLSTVASSNNGNIPLKRRSPSKGKSMNTTSRLDEPNDIPKQEDSNMLDWDLNETNYSKRREVLRSELSSDLNLKSLNLMGCTETQHRFLAQEALDCTKALLEDEVLAEQSFSVASKSMSLPDDPKSSNRSAEEKGRMKRLVRDSDLTGQPPSKRRLLEEFDRMVDGPKALHPVKSCPDSLMKDRRVFKYSAALHPNVTKPHGVANMYTDTKFQRTTLPQRSTPGGGRVSLSKMPAFVPPFIKTIRRETLKNPELKENTRTPAFVPPFKKQRTVLQERSSKQQEVKRQLSFITESSSNTFTSSTDVTSSADPKNQNMTTNEGVPVNCEAVSSGAEALDVNNSFSRIQDKQNIELARDMQDMRIRKKKRQTIRPLPGSLFLTKTSGLARIPLKVAVKGKNPSRCSPKQLYEHGVQKHVSEITSETAESFRFSLLQFIKQETIQDGGGVQLADGGWLIPRNDWTAGKEEFYRALCDTPGVDPKLISEPWVYNHYRWIVWKQASMEKSFPETMGSFCLTPEQVLLQLKYRYDVEVDHSRRPALRKIMEKDDTAAKTLILCVCEIVSKGHSPNKRSHNTKTPQSADAMLETSCAVVRLTDGWYAVKAQLDEPLTAMLHKDLLTVGGKLIIHGAQLMGSQDACSPLEAPDSLMLKISANSSRRARWDAKLGFHRNPRPFLLPLSSLYSSGGPVGCVDAVILRSYPIQWMERKADGVVFRSARAEEKEARRFDSQKHKAMETLFAKIQADFEKEGQGDKKPQEKRKSMSHQDIASLQDGEELYEALGDDPSYFEACLSEQQLETLHAYRRSLMEKKQVELQDRYRRALEAEDSEMSCPKRDVTPVWKLSIADSRVQTSCVYQLNLWRPSSDLQSLLKEGRRYKVYNLVTSDGKKRSGIEAVQLTGTKKTQFQDLQASQEWLANCFQPRVSTDFVKLQNAEFQPLCGEVDLTGYVIRVLDEQGSSPAFYLADGMLNFVKVRCFYSLSQAGLEGVVKPGVLLALSNLQLRGQSLHPTPVVYAGDLTVFSANPKEVHLQKSLSQLRNLIQCQDDFFQIAEEKLSHSLKSHTTTSISSPSLQPQTPISDTDRKQESNTNVTFQKPVRSLGSFTPVSRNPSAATPSSEKDPRHLKRKRALDYLSRIPSPPPLSHLGSSVSPCINKTFNPPRRSGTPSTLKPAQTQIRKPTDSLVEDEWVNDEELAMIDTQALRVGDLL